MPIKIKKQAIYPSTTPNSIIGFGDGGANNIEHYTDLAPLIQQAITDGEIAVSGSGLTNGDKGDVVLSGSPAASVWTIDNNAITTVKIADANVTMAKLAQASATTGQAIAWNGTAWAPATIAASVDLEYQATPVTAVTDEGCFVTCTAAGATFARTGGLSTNTEGTVTIPEGERLRSVTVHFATAQAPGTTYFLNLDYLGTAKAVNGDADTLRPLLGTVTTKPVTIDDTTPATNYVHSGTPIQIGIAGIDDNGTRIRYRVKITNYAQQVGAAASILTLIIP